MSALFFLFTIQLLSEILVTATVVPSLAFLEGAFPAVRASIHRGEDGEGMVGVVG
jgi:hypothetical protein